MRAALATSLPSEMMPHFILTVEKFPRTDSTKIDRRALAKEVQLMIFANDQVSHVVKYLCTTLKDYF